MKYTSFELFHIQGLIEEKMNELKKELIMEKNDIFKKELEKYIDEYRNIYKKTTALYKKVTLEEIHNSFED